MIDWKLKWQYGKIQKDFMMNDNFKFWKDPTFASLKYRNVLDADVWVKLNPELVEHIKLNYFYKLFSVFHPGSYGSKFQIGIEDVRPSELFEMVADAMDTDEIVAKNPQASFAIVELMNCDLITSIANNMSIATMINISSDHLVNTATSPEKLKTILKSIDLNLVTLSITIRTLIKESFDGKPSLITLPKVDLFKGLIKLVCMIYGITRINANGSIKELKENSWALQSVSCAKILIMEPLSKIQQVKALRGLLQDSDIELQSEDPSKFEAIAATVDESLLVQLKDIVLQVMPEYQELIEIIEEEENKRNLKKDDFED